MDIYKSHYFILAVTFQKAAGLWPYDSTCKRMTLRALYFLGTVMMIVPQVIGLSHTIKVDTDQAMYHMAVIMYAIMISMKIFTAITAEKGLKSLYDNLQINANKINIPEEKDILINHFDIARLMVLYYTVYVLAGALLFVLVPWGPQFLDVIKPLENKSRDYIYLLDGDFLIDRGPHFILIYIYELYTAFITMMIVLSVDSMYVVCTEQCLALFSIIRARLLKTDQTGNNNDTDQTLMLTIKMHQNTLRFAKVIADTYNVSFLILTGINLIYFSTLSVLLIINLNSPLNLFRYTLLLLFLAIHLFYLSWPGQKFIDSSTNLFYDSYDNKWYNITEKSKKELLIFALRCLKPSELSAGGLYVMNFENYMKVMKTSISYITVFASFR